MNKNLVLRPLRFVLNAPMVINVYVHNKLALSYLKKCLVFAFCAQNSAKRSRKERLTWPRVG